MKNTTLLLLSFFLLLPTVTQCMEPIKEIIVFTPKTMQDIRNDRDAIYSERFNLKKVEEDWPLDLFLFQENWSDTLDFIEAGKQDDLDTVGDDILEQQLQSLYSGNYENLFPILYNPNFYKNFNRQGYSCLGYTAMAIKNEKMIGDNPIFRGERQQLFKNKQAQQQASFIEKKEVIQQLIILLDIKPTVKDKKVALLALYETFGPCIIQKICIFKHFPLLTEINMPEEINTYIALLMFETEESLL